LRDNAPFPEHPVSKDLTDGPARTPAREPRWRPSNILSNGGYKPLNRTSLLAASPSVPYECTFGGALPNITIGNICPFHGSWMGTERLRLLPIGIQWEAPLLGGLAIETKNITRISTEQWGNRGLSGFWIDPFGAVCFCSYNYYPLSNRLTDLAANG
jgi:hypothetical protein